MSADLEKMAEEIRRQFKDCTSIALWGGNVVRPGDQLFVLKSVQVADGQRLVLVLGSGDPPDLVIEAGEPSGLEIDKTGILTIAKASYLAVNSRKRQPRDGDSSPALRLQ